MNKSYMIIECQQGHRFRHGLLDKGYSKCPRCDSMLGKPYYVPREKVQQLVRISQAWQEKHKEESNKHNSLNNLLSIEVDMNTDKLQLKLRAIAKHCEALANELAAIDTEHDNDLPTRLEGSE